jgi:hypothetical protein
MKRHNRACKKKSIVYKCPACSKYYKHKARLALHLKRVHFNFCSSSRQLKCNICGRIFSTRFQFDNHKRLAIAEMKELFREGDKRAPTKRAQKYLIKAINECQGGRFCTYLEEFKRYV